MNLYQFEQQRQPEWIELEDLVALAGGRPEMLGADRVRRLARLYRRATADLAYARQHFSYDPVVDRLEAMVGRARILVYERPNRTRTVWGYLSTEYWQALRARRTMLWLAVGLFAAAAAFGVAVATTNPAGTVDAMPDGFRWVLEAESTDIEVGSSGLAGFSLYVMTNNILVTLSAFAMGVTWGVGTLYSMAYNGFVFGALGTLAVSAGNGALFVAAVVGHGVLELSCVFVAGAAGFSLGRALLRPGSATRGEALRQEGMDAFRLALGTAPWLILAGILEGFLSRIGLGWQPTLVVGAFVGAVFWGLYLWRGRAPGGSAGHDAFAEASITAVPVISHAGRRRHSGR